VLKPVKKISLPLICTKTIDVGQKPGVTIVPSREFYCDKVVLKDKFTSEGRALPSSDESTLGSNRGQGLKGVKTRRAEFSKEQKVKSLSLCFLEAEDITTCLR
jgi:hypothetical protein